MTYRIAICCDAVRVVASSIIAPVLLLGVLSMSMIPECATAQTQVKMDGESVRKAPLPLIDSDTLLYVENRGLDRIFVTINESTFRLVADPTEVERAANAFPIPRRGEITIHVGAFIVPGGNNFVEFASQGAPSADADIVMAPVFVNGQTEVAYKIKGIEVLSQDFDIVNYPNPFSGQTTIEYQIPGSRINSIDVVIEIYDVLGRRIVAFDEGARFPGTFVRHWRPSSAISSGRYFARISTDGTPQTTISMVCLR